MGYMIWQEMSGSGVRIGMVQDTIRLHRLIILLDHHLVLTVLCGEVAGTVMIVSYVVHIVITTLLPTIQGSGFQDVKTMHIYTLTFLKGFHVLIYMIFGEIQINLNENLY